MKKIKITLVIVILISVFSFSQVQAEENEIPPYLTYSCFPAYACEEWNECVDGLQARTCQDSKCGRRDIIERKFCSKPGCRPKIECLEWSECIYTEKINNIIEGKIGFGGYHNRICRDVSECVDSFIEERPCEEFYPLELETLEKCGKEYLVASDAASNRPVAWIDLESWRENKLDLIFTQGETFYCPECFNGLKDNGEESIDCGGECKPCKDALVFPATLAMIAFWLISALFSLLFIHEALILQKSKRLSFKSIFG